jgi:hypothetical protein
MPSGLMAAQGGRPDRVMPALAVKLAHVNLCTPRSPSSQSAQWLRGPDAPSAADAQPLPGIAGVRFGALARRI